jgi:hypothetical protein
MVRQSSLREIGLLKGAAEEGGEAALETIGEHESASVDYAELYRERDAALREALGRAGAAEERAAIYEDRVGELEKLRETDRAAYDAERVTLIRELEGIRATVLMLQEPEKVVRELPAVSTTMDNADPPGFLRRLFGGGSSPSQ